MPVASWLLHGGRPVVAIEFQVAATGTFVERRLLADTGAGASFADFDLILTDDECVAFDG